MIENVVIGTPLCSTVYLLSTGEADDWVEEFDKTHFTRERFLPQILKDIGFVKSTSEIKRNRPDLWVELKGPDCFWVKLGKKRLYVVVGE